MTVTNVAGTGQPALPAAVGRAGLAGAVRSELTKIRSVRSTYWTLLTLVVVMVVAGSLTCIAARGDVAGPGWDPTSRSLSGVVIGQFVIAVLGALTITSEYSTGMIRTSLAVMPRRGTLYAAKALAFGAVSLVTGLLAAFASFFTGQAILAGGHLGASLGQPGVLRAVTGAGLFLAVSGLLAYGLGALLRYAAAAIGATIWLVFVMAILVYFLPVTWQITVDRWLPFDAGSQVWIVARMPGDPMFGPWAGLGVFATYAAVAVAAGLWAFRRRDA